MSRRKKNMRAFKHQHSDDVITIEKAWDAAWEGAQKHYHSKRMQELEQQCDDSDRELQDALNHLAALREAAATYKNNGHSPSCRRHTVYTKGGRCICGYDELASLLQDKGE